MAAREQMTKKFVRTQALPDRQMAMSPPAGTLAEDHEEWPEWGLD